MLAWAAAQSSAVERSGVSVSGISFWWFIAAKDNFIDYQFFIKAENFLLTASPPFIAGKVLVAPVVFRR